MKATLRFGWKKDTANYRVYEERPQAGQSPATTGPLYIAKGLRPGPEVTVTLESPDLPPPAAATSGPDITF